MSGRLGIDVDTDGWEYQKDFNAFSVNRRVYKRGDTVRRRRWTRTRMMMPPKFNDPCRCLSLVWESKVEESGVHVLCCRSHLQLHNETNMDLSIFMFNFSWLEEAHAGDIRSGQTMSVPIQYADGSHLSLAKKRKKVIALEKTKSLASYMFSERLMIIPTSYKSSLILRCSINCQPSGLPYQIPSVTAYAV